MTRVRIEAGLFDRFLALPLLFYVGIVAVLVFGIFPVITREALVEAFRERAIWHAAGLSVFSSLASTALSILIAVPAGYFLSRRRFPGLFLVDTLLDLPIVLPPLVLGLCVLLFFDTAVGRFIDTRVVEFVYTWRGIVLVQFVVGCALAIRVVKAGFDSLDVRYEELAMTLGANRWRTFSRVSVPMATPSLVAAAVIVWARILGLFGPVILVAGSMRNRTEILPTTIFLEVSIGRIEVALVVGAFLILVSVATLVLFKRLGGKGYLW